MLGWGNKGLLLGGGQDRKGLTQEMEPGVTGLDDAGEDGGDRLR